MTVELFQKIDECTFQEDKPIHDATKTFSKRLWQEISKVTQEEPFIFSTTEDGIDFQWLDRLQLTIFNNEVIASAFNLEKSTVHFAWDLPVDFSDIIETLIKPVFLQ